MCIVLRVNLELISNGIQYSPQLILDKEISQT